MPTAPRHPRDAQEGRRRLSRATPPPQKKAGRPPGAPSTIVNLRIPGDLLARLDRDLDQREVQTGRKANRGMLARRAFELCLESRTTGPSPRTL